MLCSYREMKIDSKFGLEVLFLKCLDLQVWDFKGRELKSRWEVGYSVVKIVFNRLNGNLYLI